MLYTASNGCRMIFSIPVTPERVERYARYHERGIASSGGFTTDDGRIGHWAVVPD